VVVLISVIDVIVGGGQGSLSAMLSLRLLTLVNKYS
jgi:hypothetical protein